MSGFAVDITEGVSGMATSSPFIALAANNNRNYLLIQNLGSSNLSVSFGSSSVGILIPAGGNFEPEKGIRSKITVSSTLGSQSYAILGGN